MGRYKSDLTAERLRQLVYYDPESGIMYWRETRGQQLAGSQVGRRFNNGYLRAQIDNGCFFIHRVAWLYVYGEWPAGWIDHINRHSDDNRIDNLRDVSPRENLQNRRWPASPEPKPDFVAAPWVPEQRDTTLTADKVRALMDYDPVTGVLKWKQRAGKYPAGTIAGYINTPGYRMVRITIGGRQYHMIGSRLAWLHYHGYMPKHEIDHINANQADDRICNLREATSSQNKANMGIMKRNTSGYRGVSWVKSRRKWVSQIWLNGKSRRLGYFDTPEEASVVYKAAERLHRGDFVRAA